jgi:F0F1-type ATP synthase assembly protein I
LRNISQSHIFAPVKPGQQDTNRDVGAGYTLLTIGITFALTLALFVYGGLLLDRRMASTPLWTIVGALVGMGLAGFWMYQRLRRLNQAGQ